MNRVDLIEKEIERILVKSDPRGPAHAQAAKKWVLKLKPNADEALQIAALAHDIERGVRTPETRLEEDFTNYEEIKRKHSEIGARAVRELLEKNNFEEIFIKKVEHLVRQHEFGGDEDSDILMDADSLAFFETNLEYYFKKFGEEKTKKKITFMYERMSEKAIKLIEQIEFKNKKIECLVKETIF